MVKRRRRLRRVGRKGGGRVWVISRRTGTMRNRMVKMRMRRRRMVKRSRRRLRNMRNVWR